MTKPTLISSLSLLIFLQSAPIYAGSWLETLKSYWKETAVTVLLVSFATKWFTKNPPKTPKRPNRRVTFSDDSSPKPDSPKSPIPNFQSSSGTLPFTTLLLESDSDSDTDTTDSGESIVRTDSESDYSHFSDPRMVHTIPRILLSRNLAQERTILLAALRMETDGQRKREIMGKLLDLIRYESSQQHD